MPTHKTILLVLLLIIGSTLTAQVRHTYRFNHTLSTTEADCAEDLVPTKGLNQLCQSSTAATAGSFVQDVLPFNPNRTVYHNNLNWGLKYANTSGTISKTYTVQIYLKVVNFNQYYTRLIDFSNGVEDNGIYFTNYGTPPPADQRCFNFYPNGNFGVCPFFNNSTYYLLTITRNDATKNIDIYVNDQLFTTYNDNSNFYTSTAGKPVHIFRDDPVGFACEDGQANFAYLSFANYYSTQTDVSAVYQNIQLVAAVPNTADFSLSTPSTCIASTVTVNYTGNIPSTATQYNFNWDWDGGSPITGTGRGPYTVAWNVPGTKTVTLNITGGPCASSAIATQQLMIQAPAVSTLDTAICPGSTYQGYSAAGTYQQHYTATNGCDSTRTITLSIAQPSPAPQLIAQHICQGDTLVLDPGPYLSYSWQNGSTDRTYTVRQPGPYSVTVTDKCNSYSAQTTITSGNCAVYFPTAFTPNQNGRNETFRVLTDLLFAEYHLQVFNRWGQKVFETSTATNGWDGKVQGTDAETGTYVWNCHYRRMGSAEQQNLKGTVVIIR